MSSSGHVKSDAGKITVRDNNVDQALRVLKKKLQREGVFREMKTKQGFISKGEKTREAQKAAVIRNSKAAVKAFMATGLSKPEAQAAVRNNEPRPPKIKRSPR